jgi:hypothetical protein
MPSSKKNANGNDDDCLVLGVGLFWAPSWLQEEQETECHDYGIPSLSWSSCLCF